MKQKRLSLAVVVMMVLALMTGVAVATNIDIEGTFTPTSSTTASVNETAPAYGNIAPGGNATMAYQLSNDGTVTIDSTINTSDASADLTKVIKADLDATDEYSIIWENTDGDQWTDLDDSPETLKNDLAPTGTHNFAVNVMMNSVGISAAHGAQDFAVTVVYTANT